MNCLRNLGSLPLSPDSDETPAKTRGFSYPAMMKRESSPGKVRPPMTPGASKRRRAGVQARRRLGGSEDVFASRLRDFPETSERTDSELIRPPLDRLVIEESRVLPVVGTTPATATTVSLCGRNTQQVQSTVSGWKQIERTVSRIFRLQSEVVVAPRCTIDRFWMETNQKHKAEAPTATRLFPDGNDDLYFCDSRYELFTLHLAPHVVPRRTSHLAPRTLFN